MANLIALTACDGLLPVTIGGVSLTEVAPDRLMSVAPFAGQQQAVVARLQSQIGLGLPPANRSVGQDGVTVQWFGHGVWLVWADVSLDGVAAVTDQTDAWAVVAMTGAGGVDVLARLVPIDLRPAQFKIGHTARTLLGHISVAITRKGADAFEIMVMRSMAGTLVHELSVAMQGVATR